MLLPRLLERRAGSFVVLAAALLCAAVAMLLTDAEPAQAALHNPIPANCADEEPTDIFTDADALCAYMTSDFRGGRVCIVYAFEDDPEQASCDLPAWWKPTRIIGIGTVFTLVKGPPLQPGSYRLLVEDSDGGGHELSLPFTIVSCPECSHAIGAAAAQRFKDAAAANSLGVTIGCAGLNLKDGDTSGGAGFLGGASFRPASSVSANSLSDAISAGRGFAKDIVSDNIDTSSTGSWGAQMLGFALDFEPGFANPGEAKALELLKELTCGLQQMYADIVADPPSSEYQTIPVPTFSTFSSTGVASADTLATKVDRLRAFGLAELRAYERYQGATADGEEQFVHAQARAIADLGRDHIAELAETADALRAYADHLDTLPEFAGPVLTQEERDALSVVYNRVRSDGFTTQEVADLQGLGFSDAEIASIRSHFHFVGPEDVPVDQTLQALMRETALNLESQVEGYDEFAIEAAVVAGRTNQPPDASFTASPPSGPVPLEVSFDDTSTSADLDPIERLEWNFGDSSTGTGASPSHTYTAAGDYLVTLTACDYLDCATEERTITVSEPNDPPTAVVDSLVTAKNTSGSVNVLLNDSDPNGDLLAVTAWTNGAHGFVTCNFAGSCNYMPETDFVGSDSFTYTIDDGHGGTATGSVDVTVSEEPPANRPPSAVNDVLATGQDAAKTVDVLRNDSDADGDPLSVIDWTQGDQGGAVVCAGDGQCTYTPAPGFTGSDSFTYTLSDGRGGTAIGTVAVTVDAAPVNRDPVAQADVLVTGRNQPGTVAVLENDSDPDGDQIAISGWLYGEHGFVDCSGDECTYFPAFDYTGPDSFTYFIYDGRGGTATGTVSITVFDTNRPPVAVDDTLFTRRDTPAGINVLANDSDPDLDPLALTVTTPPERGTLDCASWGDCSYAPEAGFFGSDSAVYSLSDGHGGTATATVSITVERNRLPIAGGDSLEVERNVPASVDVLANDSDPDDDSLSVSDATDGAHGTVSCDTDGNCTYTPETGFVGFDQFGYTVSDGSETATGTVNVFVRDLLAAGPDWVWRPEKSLSFPITINDPAGVSHTCAWDFGDGDTSDTCTFEHTYAEVGTYEATITVDFSNGVTRTEVVEIRVIADDPDGGGGGNTGRGEVVTSTDRTYSLDDDFDAGTLLNVNHDAPNNDELRLNTKATPFPFLYVAASARGTAVRIDIDTGEILGEFLTAPDGRARNPSRTTVDKLGNVWVTNRDEAGGVMLDGVETSMGSLARVGLLIGGTRADADGTPNPDGGYVKPPFQYSTCVDRDADGLIRTSNGLGDILDWTNAANVDDDGGVQTAADECLINYTRVLGIYTRTVAIDSNNDAWIGGANTWHEKVDGDTGERVPGTAFTLDCGGYGGLIDGNDVLWSARYGNGLLRYDTRTGTGECHGSALGDYGLGVDPATGHIWHTYVSGDTVVKINPDGTEAGRFSHGFSNAQGVAVDASANVWVAHSLLGGTTVGHVRTDGTLVGSVDLRGGSGPTGVAVDSNGRVWSANLYSDSATRIDPEIGPVGGGGFPVGYTDLTVDLGPGAGPYNYSDMTGAVSVGAASPSGFWSIVQDGGAPRTQWTSIAWNGLTPAGTEIEVEARVADTQVGLASEPFVVVANDAPLSFEGRFIEVRANLRTTDRDLTPVLRDIRIASTGSAPNQEPVAQDGMLETAEDTAKALTLVASDPDGDPLTYEIVSVPAHGSLSGSSASRTYMPAANYHGPDSFTFRASDGALSDEAVVSITVTPVNDTPVAADAAVTTDEDIAIELPFAGSDVDGDELTFEVVTGPEHGTLEGRTYTPDASYHGPDAVTFSASDGELSDEAVVSITVTPVNDAPTASDLAVATDEDTAVEITLEGADPEGDELTFAVATGPAHGTLTGSGATLTYTPDADYNGPDSFTYTGSDGTLTSGPATVAITIRPVNDAPTAADGSVTTPEDTAVELPFAGSDPDGDELTFEVVSGPEHGTLEGRAYTPALNYHGSDAVTFSASDGEFSDQAVVEITVTPVNDSPVAVDDAVSTDEDTPLAIPEGDLLANDSDVDGDTLSISAVSDAENGTVELAEGLVTFTPAPGYDGSASFQYTVSDGNGDTDLGRVDVTVRPVGHAPTATDQSVETDEDTAVEITLSGSDPDGDPLTFEVATGPTHGTLTGSGATLTYTPDSNYNGSDSFTYTASDSALTSAPATVTIAVHAVNDAPVAADAAVTTAEDTAVELPFAGSDVDGDELTFEVVSGPEHGTLEGRTYTPDLNYHGPDAVTFSASDGALSDEALVSITVTPANDAPVAVDDSAVTDEDTALAIPEGDLLANDTDVDGDALTVSAVSDPEHGTVELAEGVVTFTPAPGFSGPALFRYTVSDGNGGSASAQVAVTVRPVAHTPTADDLAVETDEDTAVEITLSGSDPDGDDLTFDVATGPAHGTLSGSGASRTYAPNVNYNGSDSFTYTASDGTLSSASATVSITVRPVNDAPVAADDAVTTEEDTAVELPFAGSDPDGDELTFEVVDGPEHGTLEGRTYTPAANYHGPDAVTFSASDGVLSDEALVSITVTPANDAPVAVDDSAATNEDTPLAIPGADLRANDTDADGDTLSISAVSDPEHGTVDLDAGIVTFAPAPNYNGPASFRYTVSDGNGGSATATVAVTVRPVNDAPVAADDAVTTEEDTAKALTLVASDPDGDPLTYTIVSGPAHGSLSGSGASRTYTPAANYHGPDAVTFRASDSALSDEALVSITVTPANDSPVAVNDAVLTDEDTPLAIPAANLLANDTDVDGDSLTIVTVGSAEHGSVGLAGGVVTFTPASGYHGPASFRYTVSDGHGGSATATVAVTVHPVNDAPLAQNGSLETDQDTAKALTLVASDPDGDALTYTIVGGPANGSLSGSGASRTYTPDPGFSGTDSFTFRVSDGQADSNLATVSITVREVQVGAMALLIDDDSIDNGKPPNFFSATSVNDRIARIGLRATLPAFDGVNEGRNLVLHTGQVGSEGWHALKTIPQRWAAAGPTADGLRNFLLAGPGLGSGRNPERLLDKVRDVTPLRGHRPQIARGAAGLRDGLRRRRVHQLRPVERKPEGREPRHGRIRGAEREPADRLRLCGPAQG